ncbi:MAG: LLM class flavin-dependent oxidoreductase [Bosea sp. (in: a-proteobacteria)]|uniref:LLM class flavin-dependent oxidoreductase n=1 Tax=Bosea sp. (in: a-proteobacteria) TaxID=1871050 RepID=UPI002736A139|nr:LLM class flavin-dependent oxidoreductase [Bosea sp. (in: a-proteobacteria)]MDP3603181.1 LLM class flavin-dependent oxidoreductase [Bosea sp. (in: a-proteobacteria)]WRH56222.1 MAG: LLM class flavin-dependent oxidoreductase [Bosea sp. (in: a-proteobacteria)]
MVAISVLDLVPVREGQEPGDALRASIDLARHAESLGYTRYWVAEHHNMVGIASAATAVVIGQLAAATKTIRVGAGGIMLPNHAPLIIAEQFGTLEALFPGRIDLGLGRAPGTDQLTMRAMRRNPMSSDSFPQDVLELQAYFAPAGPNQAIQAVPGAGLNVPLWILGSSLFGSQLAAELGLPYAFASHFAPDALMQALAIYRERFKPSEQLARPHAMPGINVIAAETDAEARHLATSLQQRFVGMVRGQRGKLQPPIDDIETYWSPNEKAHVAGMLRYAFIGSPETLKRQLGAFITTTRADEIMVTAPIFDHEARKRSYEILSGIAPELGIEARAA